MLDLRQLRYFVAVAESGALSYAAQKLNIAQSAVSHHLAELEAKLNLSLVERHSRGVTLTPAGARLYERAKFIIGAVAKAEAEVRAFSEEARGPVSLGLSHTVTHIIAVTLMRSAKALLPQVMLGMVEAMSIPLATRLLAEELEIAVLYNPPEDARLDCLPILEEDLYFVGSPDLLSGRQDPINFNEILSYPLVMPHPTSTSRSLIESFYLRNRLPDRVMEFDSMYALNSALIEGIGCSVLSQATVRQALEEGALIGRRIISPEIKRTLYVATLRHRPMTRAASEVYKLVVEALRSELGRGAWPGRSLLAGAAC